MTGNLLDDKGKRLVLYEGDENSDTATAALFFLRTDKGWIIVKAHTGLYDAIYLDWQHRYRVAAKLLGGR